MKRLFLTLLVACVAGASLNAGAQTQGGATGSTTGARQTNAPAATTPTPAQTPAATTPKVEDCGCEAKPLPEVLAVVDGVQITKKDISPETQQRVNQLKQSVIEARKRELDLQVNSRLLEAEAKKRNTTTAKLIESEVVAKAGTPTEAEAQAFYDQNKSRIPNQFSEVKESIIQYLTEQRQRDAASKFAERLRTAAQVKFNVKPGDVTPPATPADRARVLAEVNGERITSGDVEDTLRPLIFSVQEQMYALYKQEIDMKVNDLLLQTEAQKRKMTARAVLEAEVTSKTTPVTETEAQAFYNQNKERINGDFAQVKTQIIQYLQESNDRKAETAFAAKLRNSAAVQVFITEPEPPVYNIATDDQPTKGNPAASVTIVEFTDFQCPSCAQTHPTLERLMSEYGDRVKLVVRDFPLGQHANAFKAAEAAEAAREQGKYWEYVALLFNNQSALEVDKLKQYATTLGLDRAKFDAALDSGRFSEKVSRDQQDGNRLGVSGTPTLFLNGRPVKDRSYEGLKALIEDALKKSSAKK